MKAHKSMPHDDELERSVLSACVYFDADRAIVCEQLTGDDFYSGRNVELFSVVRSFEKSSKPCDPLLLRSACALKPNVLELLDELEANVGLHPDIAALCSRLRALSSARRVTRAAAEVYARGIESSADPDTFLDAASKELTAALQSRDSSVQTTTLGDACSRLLETITQDGVTKASGCLDTGIRTLERVLGGLENGRLYVVAGRPGMGKSAAAVQFAEAASMAGARCAVFSLEMPSSEITKRMACSAARIDSRALDRGALNELEWKRFTKTLGKLAELPIVFPEATSLTVEQISRIARQEKLRGGLGLVLVDYLQLVRSSRRHDSREQEVSEISRELKLLARELDVPVIAVAQLNRELERRSDKRPMLSDLRESGAVEQDADVVLMLYREDYYDHQAANAGTCEVIIAKNRGGETGIINVRFEARFTRFSDL